jgi:hypothetical protein
MESKKIVKTNDIVKTAIENKGRIEKAYWTNQEQDTDDISKLLNSSLHIYIDHRRRVLSKFDELIRRFDSAGEEKRELEESIHDLLMKRGESFKESRNINHLHNLWILDDKYAIFSDTRRGLSTRKGQGLSDIYFWIDDPNRPRELLILELKSTTHAHNAADKYESMVAQVKRYAAKFYNDPEKIINRNHNTEKILYSGIILARKEDVNRELNSNNSGGSPNKIPFLENSWYFNERFSVSNKNTSQPILVNIRIDMFSYEDIHNLSTDRNRVFLNLLKGEFKTETEGDE